MLNIESLISWIKNHKLGTLLGIIGLLLLPLLFIHLLFKWNTGCDFLSAEWSAGDLIGYIAGFEAFAGTVVLGIVAVSQNDKANKTNSSLLNLTEENERKSVLPFLSFNQYIPKYEGDIFTSLLTKALHESQTNKEGSDFIPLSDTSKRIDLLLSELCFTVSNDRISLNVALDEEKQEKINNGFGIKKQSEGVSVTPPDYCYKKIYIENCGKGSAINVKCRLYKVGHEASEQLDVYSIPFTIPIGRHFDLGLYFDMAEKFYGNYNLVFIYRDIYMNEYTQTIPLELSDDDSCIIDFYQPQKQSGRKIFTDKQV